MSKNIDYSKWDHIEVSDDEDDTHPNIDTPSLFRWRHKARVERDEEFKKDKDDYEKNYKGFLNKFQDIKDKVTEAKKVNSLELPMLEKELNKLEEEAKEWKEKCDEMKKKEKSRPLNIDTICKEGKTKTIINKFTEKEDENEADIVDRMKTFVEKYEKEIKQYGLYRKAEDTERFLMKHTQLVCENTANHLVIWCIDLAVEEKTELMKHVSHQCIVMQFILELAKSLKRDPRECIKPFFVKFRSQEPEYQTAFNSELDAFRVRIKERAEIRIQDAMEKYEEEERLKRLGPGGLDPLEVFQNLPKELQDCFEQKDIPLLQKTLEAMDPVKAEEYMRKCVDSGMWLPEANKHKVGNDEEETSEEDKTAVKNDEKDDIKGKDEEEHVYSECGGDATK